VRVNAQSELGSILQLIVAEGETCIPKCRFLPAATGGDQVDWRITENPRHINIDGLFVQLER